MTVISKGQEGIIELSGQCGAADAEVLQRCLLEEPRSIVEWSRCEYLHSAVIQVLLVGMPELRGLPHNGFLRSHIAPLLDLPKQPPRRS